MSKLIASRSIRDERHEFAASAGSFGAGE